MNKMILKILLLTLLQTILAAPLQMLQQLQGIMQQMPSIQPQEMNHQLLLQQLQRLTQQQVQQQFPGLMYQPTQLLQPLQGTVQQQRLALEEQMLALQQFQALQRMNLIPSATSMNTPPILVLYPNNESDMKRTDFNRVKFQKPEKVGDDDTEVIDAEATEEISTKVHPLRAFLLMPNSRGFIGDFISNIPFLPIEINVPDTISWIYNGIAGIIAGIGQNLPFRPQTESPVDETQNAENSNMKTFWNKRNQQMPIVMIPLGH